MVLFRARGVNSQSIDHAAIDGGGSSRGHRCLHLRHRPRNWHVMARRPRLQVSRPFIPQAPSVTHHCDSAACVKKRRQTDGLPSTVSRLWSCHSLDTNQYRHQFSQRDAPGQQSSVKSHPEAAE